MSKQVKFTKDTKKWDGLNKHSRIFIGFMKIFSRFPLVKITQENILKYVNYFYEKKGIKSTETLENLFGKISNLIRYIKVTKQPVPLLRTGGASKLYVTKDNLQFLDHVENVLIELIFV